MENNTLPCACMGPKHGDPYCYCEMLSKGLIPSENYKWTQEDKDKLDKILIKIFEGKNNAGN